MKETEVSLICKALGDPNRLRIVELLTGGELCACKVLEKLKITQPTLSHHMKVLYSCGLVQIRREGKWSYYSLNCATFRKFRERISGLECSDHAKAGCCR